MIHGVVNANYDAVVKLSIVAPSGRTEEIEAVVDTGFNGFLTLPLAVVSELRLPVYGISWARLADGTEVELDVYRAGVMWDGRLRYVGADATGNKPLIGMSLLHGHRLSVEVVEGGRVVVEGLGG